MSRVKFKFSYYRGHDYPIRAKTAFASFATIARAFLLGLFGARVKAAAASDLAIGLDVGSRKILWAALWTRCEVRGLVHRFFILSILWGGAG